MRQRQRLPKTVILLGLTSLFTDVGTEMIFPLLPLFLVETLKASPTYLGLVEGTADTVAGLLKLASGVIADAVQRRKPLVLFGYALASAARPFVAVATRPWHVLAVRSADRVGKGIRGAPRDALIADAAGDAPGRAFGFNQAMDNAGAVVGPLLATMLLGLGLALRSVFWLAVIPGAIATVFVAAVAEEPRKAATSLPGVGTSGSARRPLGRPLVAYLLILALFSMGNSSDAFLLLRARSLGFTTESIPLLWAVLNFSKVLWAYFGGNLADRMPRVHLIASGWLVYALVYLGLAAATSPWHVWILFAIYGVFYGLTEPVEKALVKDLSSPSTRGRAYGAYNFVVGTTALPAGLLAGALWRSAGPNVALEVGAGLAAIACLAILAWDHGRRTRRSRR
ncbi:MAG TPA: MFS transporter [Polyangiaceae bacterium]|jgi:MFS family permease|nr:MFS transporter [Polyangiaceae bacterium]